MSPVLLDLRLTDFRCFERLRFEPAPGTNFLIGANAQGKTSILEAICVVARLQSPRTTSLAEVVRHGCPGCAIDVHLAAARQIPNPTDHIPREIRLEEAPHPIRNPQSEIRNPATHLHLRYEPPKRALQLDSVPQSGTAEYLRVARVAWFANDDLEILRGSSSKRRRYLDFLCAQLDPAYLRHLRAYEKALRSRNALLKDARPAREIAAFDPILLTHGEALSATRADAATALAPLIAAAARDIAPEAEELTSSYLPSPISQLPASRGADTRLRQTTVGPHRDDLTLELNGRDAARFASEGQQRTVALALKLAQTRLLIARTGATPLLLIDDVFGELDPTRRQRLLAHLPADSQRLITTTHLDWLDPALPHTTFRLENHALHAAA